LRARILGSAKRQQQRANYQGGRLHTWSFALRQSVSPA
jgi:hypothetical protein